ncbi:hypothetical protein GLAREA_09888 [Glarea lozoyensis ATCC 20868]|uniref:Uncharacterized protein n=1 Tax=Glarea lozoyensis (strain ATCC 20868 / MF5171) TaxID=1116229 RepID=S3CQQ1_GLAL2|nr:uncharacterized protein GLAREA_09888 [Glarea lozoyensis ATCC 20868]EPE28767.1 hypothetical protein GLAREA_09888 [Glarea lozoyensis ATCC 20868]
MAHSTSEFNKSSTKIVETHSETGVQAVRAGDAGVSAFLRTVERIRDDLAELERLLKVDSVKTHLNGTPDKLPYIENVAKNTKAALKEVEVLIEREGANQTANTSVGDCSRKMSDGIVELMSHRFEISVCHQALLTALAFLNPLEKPLVNLGTKPPVNRRTKPSNLPNKKSLDQKWDLVIEQLSTSTLLTSRRSGGLSICVSNPSPTGPGTPSIPSTQPTSPKMLLPPATPPLQEPPDLGQSSSPSIPPRPIISDSKCPPTRSPPAVSSKEHLIVPMTMSEQKRRDLKEMLELMGRLDQ